MSDTTTQVENGDTPASTYYGERLQTLKQTYGALDKTEVRLGYVRALSALGAVVLMWLTWGLDRTPSWTVGVALAVFGALAWSQGRVGTRAKDNLRRQAWNKTGHQRATGQVDTQTVAEGGPFEDPKHPYSSDLDIFSKGGLFERMAMTYTAQGRTTLATWLKKPSPPEVIVDRQAGSAELARAHRLREDMAIACLQAQKSTSISKSALKSPSESSSPSSLVEWATRPADEKFLRLGTIALPATLALAFFISALGYLAGIWNAMPPLAFFLLALIVSRGFQDRVMRTSAEIDHRAADLSALARLLAIFDGKRFDTPYLCRLQQKLTNQGVSPARRVRQLSSLVGWLDVQRNQLLALIVFPLYWGPIWSWVIERWRAKHGHTIAIWFETLGEFEALVSLATYAFENPSFSTPSVRLSDDTGSSLQNPMLSAQDLGHPLIPQKARVSNDIQLGAAADDRARLLVISGSNMSGKSTFLRAVGINAVLAQAGAVVCASRFEMSPLQVAGTLSVHDSLAEGASRFFAEITRVKLLVTLADQPPPAPPCSGSLTKCWPAPTRLTGKGRARDPSGAD